MRKKHKKMISFSKKTYAFVFSFLLLFFTKSFAVSSQKPHIHGISNLNIAFENKLLNIELKTPLMDIVGFEEKPKNSRQKKALDIASGILKNWKNVFAFKGGSCENEKILMLTGNENKKHTHKHENHKRLDIDTHSDVRVFYSFNCNNLNNLTVVEVLLFKQFPEIQQINVQWVRTNGQGQELLNKDQNKVFFR
tara:strand:+ start:58 stop:639 length:582 start_codon:yes stop_codon:yes gene_type:complete